MSPDSRSVVVIPARGGSKRLPHKNIMDLAGKPLVAHSIEAALASQCFSRVLLSSDDPDICAVAERYPGVVIDHREPTLAGDRTRVVEVILELCRRPDIQEDFDIVAMMLPTAPFRRVADIRKGMSMLSPDVDAVISFAPFDFPPQMGVTLDGDASIMAPIFQPSPLITGATRGQDQIPTFRPNGSFYMSWLKSFMRWESFYKGRVAGVRMTRLGSVDIDEKEDLEHARALVGAGLAESDFV